MKKTFSRSVCFVLAALIVLPAFLCGCTANEKGFPVPVSPEQKGAFELCTNVYTDAQLEEIYSLMDEEKNVGDLDKQYDVECLRKTDGGYRVIYVSAKKILIFGFDTDANYIDEVREACLRSLVKSVADFDKVNIGDDVSAVREIDKKSFIYFLDMPSEYTGRGDTVEASRFSDHYTEDGYCIHIVYDTDNRVASKDITHI